MVVALSTPVIRAVVSASSHIPIVAAFFGSDPVAEGMAASLAKPGGHITGVAMLAEALDAKRFDILSESLPAIRKVAVLAGRPPRHDANIKAVAAAAQKLGIELKIVEADSPAEYPGAFEKMRAAEVQGLVIVSAPDFSRDGQSWRKRLESPDCRRFASGVKWPIAAALWPTDLLKKS